MPPLPPEPDNFQQDPAQRNTRLAQHLTTIWLGYNIQAIRRDPVPSEPPNPATGPTAGRWIAEVA